MTAVECCSGCPDCGPTATKRTVEAITGRVGKVSDGPWTAWDRGIGYEVHGPEGEPINSRHRETFSRGDAEFIAMAPGDVYYLLAELRKRDEALAAVAVLAESWRYKGEFGWGAWQEGHGPDQEGTILDEVSSALRAAVADVTGDGA